MAESDTLPARRLLLVHAHPDDESIGTGATMARYVAEGAQVTLVTCTLGEEGEIVVDELKHLGVDGDDTLGEHRIGELSAAMAALGVTDHLRLGGDGAHRDSGMAYDQHGNAVARDVQHESFWTADLNALADELVPVIRSRRPQVLITYDQHGNYGHPDHIQAHRVATYAAHLAGVPSYKRELGEPWQVQRILWTAIPESAMREMVRRVRAAGDTEAFGGYDPDGEAAPPMATPDADIDVVVYGRAWFDRKIAALRAHASQIAVDSWFVNHAGAEDGDANVGGPGESAAGFAMEAFRFASGAPIPADARADNGPADDVFAGLAD